MEGMDYNVLHMYYTLFRVNGGIHGYLYEYELVRSFARYFSFASLPHILWNAIWSIHEDASQYVIPVFPSLILHSSFDSTLPADVDSDREDLDMYQPYSGYPEEFHIGHLMVLPKYIQFAERIRNSVQNYSLREFVQHVFCPNCHSFEFHNHSCLCRTCHHQHHYRTACFHMCSNCGNMHPPDEDCIFSVAPNP